MRLVSFNVGTIQPQTIDGQRVLTAHVKSPVPEPWVITPTGPAGDEVAVHTDHLYAFDRRSYDFWARELDAPRASWSDGLFAENLTLDAMDQDRLRVGHRYRLGTAVLVVTGCRVPCWKLTWALKQPKTFMRRFRLSGHSGAYFGVIRPGVVSPGDELEWLGGDADAPSVATLSVLCDSSTQITDAQRSVIDRAMACEDLSLTVRGTLALKIAALERDAGSTAGSWRGWRRFEVARVTAETRDAASFELRPADGGELPGFRAGQHVVVRLTERGRKPVTRTWSLSSFASAPDRYRITVKLRQDGLGSRALGRLAEPSHGPATDEPATTVELRTPSGQFHLDRGSFRPVVLVAAGIGITPMIAMIQAHLDRGVDAPPLWLLYGSPDPERTAFLPHLDDLFGRHPHLHLHCFFSRMPAPSGTATSAVVHEGRITGPRVIEVMLGNYLPTPEGPASIPWFESDVYVCGPVAFNAGIRESLVAAGANPDHVHAEDFDAAAVEPAGPTRQRDAVVRYASRRLEATWEHRSEQTLLELAESNDLELPFDCRAGTCRTCESKLISGRVDGPTSVDAAGTARVLLCVSYPLSDRVVVEPPPV